MIIKSFLQVNSKYLLFVLIILISGCSSTIQYKDTSELPKIIAHRAGTQDAPENTKFATKKAVENGADIMWFTVQLSKDGIPVLYRPADLSAMTQSKGPVNQKTLNELQKLNAGWNFKVKDANQIDTYPYRNQSLPIPTLEEVMLALPETMPIILDMKALPAEPQVKAVAHLLTRYNWWNRVSFYSTDATYQQLLKSYPQATLFESRDATRGRLVKLALSAECDIPEANNPVGFEYKRNVEVVEKFTLGEGRSPVYAQFWTKDAVRCFKQKQNIKIVAFGINTQEDYNAVACMGIDAVLADSPINMNKIKSNFRKKDCSIQK